MLTKIDAQELLAGKEAREKYSGNNYYDELRVGCTCV